MIASTVPFEKEHAFWVQFAALWRKLGEIQPGRREQYSEIAQRCLAKAEAFRGGTENSESQNGRN
jgi:hypothetical protein